MSELVKVLATHRHGCNSPWMLDVLDRIEAAARADHPDDWPPKDGEVRNVSIKRLQTNDERDLNYDRLVYEYAIGGQWIGVSGPVVDDHDRAALRQLASEDKL